MRLVESCELSLLDSDCDIEPNSGPLLPALQMEILDQHDRSVELVQLGEEKPSTIR
jgi:hypothetical protein